MKTKDQWIEQDGRVVHKRTWDLNPSLSLASDLRSAEKNSYGESRLAGIVPTAALAIWAGEEGVKGSDPDYWKKMQDIVRRKLNDGSYEKLRVWQGKY